MTKLLIFDWDGTLCDSLGRITHCVQRAAEDLGLPVPGVAEVHNIVGLGLSEAFALLFPGEDSHYIASLSDGYSKYFFADDLPQSSLYPFVREGLQQLRDTGYLLAVATGKRRTGLQKELQLHDLDGFFHASRCADEANSKPDPLMLDQLLAEFGFSAGQALMIGDTTYDMDMARRANMPRLAVNYGAHDRSRLQAFTPLACVDCFSTLVELLRGGR